MPSSEARFYNLPSNKFRIPRIVRAVLRVPLFLSEAPPRPVLKGSPQWAATIDDEQKAQRRIYR